ncbi:MAG TPA: hypothetical protein V6C46_04925, partial [Coleofasciculaceae cyanobacterium]
MSTSSNPLPAESQPASQLQPSVEQKYREPSALLTENQLKSECLKPDPRNLLNGESSDCGSADVLEASPGLDAQNGHDQPVEPQGAALKDLQQGAAVTEATGFFPVLRNHNFLTLWGGQVFSQLADKVYLVLMIALIASRFQSEGQTISGWVSSIMIAFTIPAVLFSSLAGVFV